MNLFSFEPIEIEGAFLIHSFFSEDDRGRFVKSYEIDIFLSHGIDFVCSESFISTSKKNVVRGMHFQLFHPQAKLVGVLSGTVYDVIVDLRKESPTFGQWRGYYLSSENRSSLLIPRGCAHGFISLSDNSMVSYQCDGVYDKDTDTGIVYNDPEIGVEWPVQDLTQVILGARDKKLMTFAQFKEKCSFIYPSAGGD